MHSFKREDISRREIATQTPQPLTQPGEVGKPSATILRVGTGTRENQGFSPNPLSRASKDLAEEREQNIEVEVVKRLSEREDVALKESRDRGYQEGLEKGRTEAQAARAEELKKLIERAEAAVSALEGAKDRVFQENEKAILRVVHEVSKKIILKEISSDQDYTKRLLVDVLAGVGLREAIEVKVRPEFKAAISELSAELAAKMPELKNISIMTSDEVMDEGFLVETNLERIDATLKTQLEQLKDVVDHATLPPKGTLS